MSAEIGARITAALAVDQRSEAYLAQQFEIPITIVDQWKSGAIRPTHDDLDRIAALLGVRLAWLENGASPMRESPPCSSLLTGAKLDS